MKNKIFIIILLTLSLLGCTKEKETNLKSKVEITDNNSEKIEEPIIEEKQTITLGLYVNKEGKRTLVTNIDNDYPQYKDLLSLEVYCTNEESISLANQKELWNSTCSEVLKEYKIGFNITFETSDNQTVSQNIIRPNDNIAIFEYVQIYLYDDINQTSSWYSHVQEEDLKEETIFSSIKLTGSTKIDNIKGPIQVTVFAYKENELDKGNNYKGKNSYQIIINRKN